MVTKSRASAAIHGVLWMLSGAGSGQVLLFIITVVLARILVPADFAAVALIMAVLAIVNTFTEMGLSVAIVQRETITPGLLDSAFVLTFSFFLVISIAVFHFSETFAHYYRISLLAPLMKIAAVGFLFQGLNSFYRSILLRETRFKVISLVSISTVTINGAIAITQAFLGYGAYSILFGQLGANIGTLIIFLAITRFVPRSFGSVKDMHGLLSFGAWVSIGRILGTSAGEFDRFLIGKILPDKVLGGYHIASRMTMAIPSLLTGMIDQVLLPIYSNAKNDSGIIERGYWRGVRYSAILIVPITLVVAIYARPLIFVVLGEKWLFITPIVQIISVFSISHSMGGGLFASAIYASGMPKLTSITNVFRIVALPACVWIGSLWGVIGVAWGIAVFGVLGRLFNQYLLKVYLGYSLAKYFRVVFRPFVANIGLLIFGILCQPLIGLKHPIGTAFMASFYVVLTLAVYGLLCRLVVRDDSIFLCHQFSEMVKSIR